MKYILTHYLSLCALAVWLTAIPTQYMPHMDAFLYSQENATLHAPRVTTTENTSIASTETTTSPSNVVTSTEELPPMQSEALLSVSQSEDSPSEETAEPLFAIAQVNNYVNIRSMPTTDSAIVGKLPNGSVAEIQGTAGAENDWFQIISGNISGYIKSEYFLSGEAAEAVMDDYVMTYARIMVDRLNVRKEATTGSKRIGYLEKEETVKVLEDTGDWLHIEYTDTTKGYIAKEYTQPFESYLYAQTSEEAATQKATYTARESRVQAPETNKPENTTKVVLPATTTYTSNEELRKAIVENALQYVGNKYVRGGNSLENGTDCSGFTMLIYAQYGYSLSRTPHGQYTSAG
ncbi:MAG: C40 family peptidase, partial [Lachnospiraceae bacterium]|nr:C40 family peptidase [Lachnospiraceae bacterium]